MTEAMLDYASMTVEERVGLVEDIFVIHPQFKEVHESISICHQKSKRSAEPKCLFVTGVSGSGKSTLARYYEAQFPRRIEEEGTTIPVLSSTIFSPATVKGIATGLLYSLGDPVADKGTIMSQTMRLYQLIKTCGVELIILDEFQHLIDRDSDRVLEVASDWLKNLLNNTGVPMVLIGMPWSVRILRANEQLRRRFSARKDLSPFEWEAAEQRNSFRSLLKVIESKLPFTESSHLYDQEMAFRLFCASRGVMSHVMTIIRKAAELALRHGMEKINMDLFAQAYDEEIAAVDPNDGNPFIIDYDRLEVRPLKSQESEGKRLQGKKRKLKPSDIFSCAN